LLSCANLTAKAGYKLKFKVPSSPDVFHTDYKYTDNYWPYAAKYAKYRNMQKNVSD